MTGSLALLRSLPDGERRSVLSPERSLATAAITLMALLPLTEVVSRECRVPGVPGSTVFVQHLTLAVAFLGAVMAARTDRLLAISANTFLPARWAAPVRTTTPGCSNFLKLGVTTSTR